KPLPASTVQRVIDPVLVPPPGETTHWTGRMLGGGDSAIGAAHPRSSPTRAAPHSYLQAVERPEVRRQAQGYRRPLCRSTRPCSRPLGRREEPNPGPRPHPAGLADQAGTCRNEVRAIKAVIPPRSTRKVKRTCDFALYAERNRVERFFNTIKHYRGIATRYEKTA